MKKGTGKSTAVMAVWRAGVALLALAIWCQLYVAAQAKEERTGWRTGAGVAVLLDEPADDAADESADAQADAAGTAESGAAAGDATETEAFGVAAGDSADAAETDAAADDTAEEGSRTDAADHAEEETDAGLVMAQVNNVLNVRVEPDSDAELAGYLYADCGGEIVTRADGWTKLVSGELTGWAKDDYLLFGEDARKAAEDTGRTVARTTTGALRIRKEPSAEAGIYDLLEEGAEYEVVDAQQLAFSDGIEISDEWVAVDYEGKTGFVSAKYVEVEFIVDHGETVAQVEERQEAERLRKEQEAKEKQKREAEKAKAMATDDAVLLAALIQCEAGDEPYEGQVAVGAVVMNRVKSGAYPGSIKDVIFASGQFTPAGSGRLGRIIASGKVKQSCLQAAAEAMTGATPVGAATHFRRAGSREGIVIGHHVFW